MIKMIHMTHGRKTRNHVDAGRYTLSGRTAQGAPDTPTHNTSQKDATNSIAVPAQH